MTVKHRVVIILGDEPEQGTDDYGGKDFEKMKVLKMRMENSRVTCELSCPIGQL